MSGKINSIQGNLISGLGEGAFFMKIPHYKNEIKNKLGFDSYPGTLNLNVSKKEPEKLSGAAVIRIGGFSENGKVFGGVSCYMAKIKNIKGAIIIPDFTKHKKNIIEFIAPLHLRSELKLKDNDEISIELLK